MTVYLIVRISSAPESPSNTKSASSGTGSLLVYNPNPFWLIRGFAVSTSEDVPNDTNSTEMTKGLENISPRQKVPERGTDTLVNILLCTKKQGDTSVWKLSSCESPPINGLLAPSPVCLCVRVVCSDKLVLNKLVSV